MVIKMKQFITFNNPEELIKFYYNLDIYETWKIQKGTLNTRGNKIKDRPYVNDLRDKFNECGFFRRSVSIAEIVSWIDGLSIMSRLCKKIIKETPYLIYNNLIIRMEYVIEYSKLMRIDYVFEYHERILLIELRMVDSFEKIRPTWNKKKLELLIYKELIENYIHGKKIFTYALITLYEFDSNRRVEKQIQYNNNQINHLYNYLRDLLLDLVKK